MVVEFFLPAPTAIPRIHASNPFDITAGADGNLWFTEYSTNNKIGRITTDGIVTEFPIPTVNSGPYAIAAGPDGNLWFTETQANQIGRITTAGVVSEFRIPTPAAGPSGIVAGPDGNLWFTELAANRIGRITTDGAITEFAIPTADGSPLGVAAGADGNLWFTEVNGNRIGRITTDGVVTEFPIPTDHSFPVEIAAGADGSLWFTESAANQIGRITTALTAPCIADSATLCLNGGRFEVRSAWAVPPESRSGIGTAVPLTGDTGYFWFFNSDNTELVVKVLDGQALNGYFWVFYGALSDVHYTITVRDTETGAVRNYENVYGNLASIADTTAFGPGGAALEMAPAGRTKARSRDGLDGLVAVLAAPTASNPLAAVCTTGGTTLCLNQSRFQVTVDWEVPSQGQSGHGTAVSITEDTGYFWFFDADNVELVTKVLDGRAINGHFWVFYGALSDVQYKITVTDSQTQAVQTYANPSGTLASVADTEAF